MPTRGRFRRLRAGAYVRMWSGMSREDQVYAMCWFAIMHDGLLRNRRAGDALVDRAQTAVASLGLPGRALSAILGVLQGLAPSELAECERVIRRGPSDDPGLLAPRRG